MHNKEEDDVTLASYQAGAKRYVERTPALGPQLSAYLDTVAARVGAGGTVLEVGSGPGRAAAYLETKLLRVFRTDATPAFVEMMRSGGYEAELLDVRTDDLGGPFDAIVATAVLLHLNPSELETFLQRAHDAVVDHGIIAFTLKEGDGSAWTTEKLDLPRHFTYWRERGLRDLMTRTKWRPMIVDRVNLAVPWLFVIAVSDADR